MRRAVLLLVLLGGCAPKLISPPVGWYGSGDLNGDGVIGAGESPLNVRGVTFPTDQGDKLCTLEGKDDRYDWQPCCTPGEGCIY